MPICHAQDRKRMFKTIFQAFNWYSIYHAYLLWKPATQDRTSKKTRGDKTDLCNFWKILKLSDMNSFSKYIYLIKFIYSEKVTKFCKIFTLLLWPSLNIWTLTKHGAVMTTFYYCSVNYPPEIRSTTFSKLIWMYSFNIMCHLIRKSIWGIT